MEYQIAKFRGYKFDGTESSIKLFHFYNSLIRDGQRNQLDPYPFKQMVKGFE